MKLQMPITSQEAGQGQSTGAIQEANKTGRGQNTESQQGINARWIQEDKIRLDMEQSGEQDYILVINMNGELP